MTTAEATLGAAVLAAGASLVSLFVNVRAAQRAEARDAQRSVLAPALEGLSAAFHECVASANVVLEKSPESEGRGNWIVRCNQARDNLKTLRSGIRFVLPGLDEAIRTLSRVPDWAQNYHDKPDGNEFLERADKLRRALDRAVSHAYTRGRPPGRWEQRWVAWRAKRVRDQWDSDRQP